MRLLLLLPPRPKLRQLPKHVTTSSFSTAKSDARQHDAQSFGALMETIAAGFSCHACGFLHLLPSLSSPSLMATLHGFFLRHPNTLVSSDRTHPWLSSNMYNDERHHTARLDTRTTTVVRQLDERYPDAISLLSICVGCVRELAYRWRACWVRHTLLWPTVSIHDGSQLASFKIHSLHLAVSRVSLHYAPHDLPSCIGLALACHLP